MEIAKSLVEVKRGDSSKPKPSCKDAKGEEDKGLKSSSATNKSGRPSVARKARTTIKGRNSCLRLTTYEMVHMRQVIVLRTVLRGRPLNPMVEEKYGYVDS